MTAVLVLQYSGRRTTLSRLILVGSVLLAAVGPNLISADQTPGARATVTRDQPDFAKISLRADVRAARANPLWREFTELQVPVQVEGMPPGGSLFVNSIEAYLDIPGRTARPFSATWVPDSAVGIQLDPVTFNGVKSTTLDLRVLLEFTVFGNPRDLPIPKDRREAVPGIGVCADRRNAFNSIEFVCYTPSPRVSLRVNMPGAAPNWIVPRGSAEQSLPASPEFQLISRFTSQLTYGKWDELQGASMHTEEPLAHIRRSLTVSQIRLQDLQPPPPFFPSDWKKWRDEQAKKRRDKK